MNRTHARGFTLLEIMVALLVFALGALSLSKVIGGAAHHTEELSRRQFALMLAHNQMVLVQLQGRYVNDSGKAVQGPFEYRWTLNVNKTDTPEIVRLDLDVSDREDEAPLVSLSSFAQRSGK